jgi:hypothetical protein
VRAESPWLYDLYRGWFRDMGEEILGQPVCIAKDDRYAVNLNVQRGRDMRYEAHVDSNPLEGLLYVTTHAPPDGGELVVSNKVGTIGIEEIERDCTRIHPVRGKLVFFDARRHPHYVSSLKNADGVRVAVAMNFYTRDCTELDRPSDLNRHLFGED